MFKKFFGKKKDVKEEKQKQTSEELNKVNPDSETSGKPIEKVIATSIPIIKEDPAITEKKNIQKLMSSQHFSEPEAKEINKLVNEIKLWYKQRANSYTGNFGGVCDDCSKPIQRNKFYLTASNSGICESCVDSQLFTLVQWRRAINDLQAWIGTSQTPVPQNIVLLSNQVYNIIDKLSKTMIVEQASLIELEKIIGSPIPIAKEGDRGTPNVKVLDNHIVELNLTPRNFWDNGSLESLSAIVKNFPKLRKLEIIRHKITTIPEDIENLVELQSLTLNQNKITIIPANIGKLQNLSDLSLYQCNLSSLPEELWTLTKITSLILSNNNLTEIPEKISNMENLYWLMLGYNEIETLPTSITQLKKLKRLGLEGNEKLAHARAISNPKIMTILEKLRENGTQIDL